MPLYEKHCACDIMTAFRCHENRDDTPFFVAHLPANVFNKREDVFFFYEKTFFQNKNIGYYGAFNCADDCHRPFLIHPNAHYAHQSEFYPNSTLLYALWSLGGRIVGIFIGLFRDAD